MKPQHCFFIFIAGISACISQIDIEQPVHEPVLVVDCILTKYTSPELALYYSNQILDTLKKEFVCNASVRIIRNDGLIYEFELSDDSTHYFSKTWTAPGYSYQLEIEHKQTIISAETSIPKSIKNIHTGYEIGKSINEYGESLTQFTLEVQDDPEEESFYQMFLVDQNNYVYHPYYFEPVTDPILVKESLLEYYPPYFLFSDKYADNSIIHTELLGPNFNNSLMESRIELIVRSVSSEYFNFLRSWIVHNYNQNITEYVDEIEDLDPFRIFFQGQPNPLYSNIEGGTGLFFGYNEQRESF